MRELYCDECLELCPELALGVADAEDRAVVLSHVESCRSCRDELASLSDVADLLSLLVPPVEPPRGFASHVVDALSLSSRPAPHTQRSRRARVRPLSVAAALVVAAAVGVGGWLASGGGGVTPSITEQTAPLLSHHRRIGEVTMVPGKKPLITVAVDLRTSAAVVRCQVESEGGSWHTVGTFDLYDGRGYWAAPLPRGLSFRRAELTTARGRVLATASLGRGASGQ